jgi:hypothetical protein
MDVFADFALPKWHGLYTLTRYLKLYDQELHTRTQLLTLPAVDTPTKYEVVAPTP